MSVAKKDSFDLTGAHALVCSSWKFFKDHGIYSDPQGRLQPTDRHECLDVTVTKAQLSRAHFVFNAIIRACEKQGWRVYKPDVSYYQRNPQTLVMIDKEEIRIAIIEKVSRRKPTPDELEAENAEDEFRRRKTFYTATGLFCIGIGWMRFESSAALVETESARLDDLIDDVIASLKREAEKSHLSRLEREERNRSAAEKERERMEEQRKQQAEQARRQNLEQMANQWHTSERIRNFVAASEEALSGNSSENPAAKLWLIWARSHADRIDPLRNGLVQQAIGCLSS